MGNSRRLVNSVFIACVLFHTFLQEVSASTRVVVAEPGSVTPTYTQGQDAYAHSDSRSWDEPVSTQNGSRVNVPVKTERKYKWPNFRNGLKNALKVNPGQMLLNTAVAAAVGAAGWVMNPENTQLQRQNSPGTPVPVTTYGWSSLNTAYCGSAKTNDPMTACDCAAAANNSTNWLKAQNTRLVFQSSTVFKCLATGYYPAGVVHTPVMELGQTMLTGACNAPMVISGYKCVDPSGATYAPITDAELQGFVDQLQNPADAVAMVPDILATVPGSYDYPDDFVFDGPASIPGHPSTTTTSHTNPDGSTTVDLSETTTNYNFEYGTNPLTINTTETSVTNNFSNGTLTSTSTTTDQSDAPVEEMPEKIDCEFMPTHCDWLEWTKEEKALPEQTEMPYEEVDRPDSVSVSVAASCPAPVVIDGGGIEGWTTLVLSFEKACNFLSDLSPIIKGVCMVIACLILLWKP